MSNDENPYLTDRLPWAYDSLMARQSEGAPTDQAILGARIARARQGKGLTKTDVARQLKVRNATVGDWEAGKNLPRGENLRRLAELLDMTADELIDVTEGKAPPFESWHQFLAQQTHITDDEVRFLRQQRWGDGHVPSVHSYEVMLGVYRGSRVKT